MNTSPSRPGAYLRSALRGLFSPPHNLDNYQAAFPQTAEAFLKFWKKGRRLARPHTGAPVGVVVMPWVGTPVPWFSMAVALGLAARGRNIALIWDETPFPTRSSFVELQNATIARVLAELRQTFPVIRLSEREPALSQAEDDLVVQRLAAWNLTWRLRAAEPTAQDLRIAESSRDALRASLARTRTLLSQTSLEYLIVPGGIPNTSGVFRLAGREVGVRVATYDTNFGVMQIATEGIAAQLSDLPCAFHALAASDAPARARAIADAQAHAARRVQGQDESHYQAAKPTAAPPVSDGSVLLPLNVEHDSAALGQHTIFEDTAEWVTATAAFVFEHSDRAVVVRQHPAERKRFERGQFDLRGILHARFGDELRLRFVAAEEPVNTYDLVRAASLVIPIVSTIGIEAAALGKPVVVAGASCYADLGFVWRPRTREEYFDYLRRALVDQLPLRPRQQEDAWLCYYFSAVCSRVWTNFTPQPSDFWRWCERSPKELYADPAVHDILTALDENVPLAFVRHQRKLALETSSHAP